MQLSFLALSLFVYIVLTNPLPQGGRDECLQKCVDDHKICTGAAESPGQEGLGGLQGTIDLIFW